MDDFYKFKNMVDNTRGARGDQRGHAYWSLQLIHEQFCVLTPCTYNQ